MSVLSSSVLGIDSNALSAIGTIAAVILSVIIGVIGIRQTRAERIRGRRKAMTDAHLYMTSGEVAAARDLAGRLNSLSGAKQLRFTELNIEALIRAFYQLCWTVEHVANVRKTWLRKRRDEGHSEFLKWNEEAVYFSADRIREALIRRDSSFRGSSARGWATTQKIARERGLV